MREYNIAVLKGDGIGPEIVEEAIRVLDRAGEKFGFRLRYHYALLGGCAIDETGVPLPQQTVDACKAADSTLLGAVGGPKWDGVPGDRRPEKGLLAGLWEYPNEPAGTRPLAAWGVEPLSEEYAGQGKHIFTHVEWHLTFRKVETETETLPQGWVWADWEAWRGRYAIPTAFQSGSPAVEERLKTGERGSE